MPFKATAAVRDLQRALLSTVHGQVEFEVRECLNEWMAAIGHGRPDPVAALYHPEAVLLATFDPEPLTTAEDRKRYFTNFTRKRGLKAVADSCHVHVFNEDAAAASGLYTFLYTAENGEETTVKARFTFNFIRDADEDRWLIVSHHSSQAPQA